MYICQYCNKEFSKRQQLAGHSVHCKNNPNYNKDKEKKQLESAREKMSLLRNSGIKNLTIREEYKDKNIKCQFCGKLCSLYGLHNHEKYCHMNPNKKQYTLRGVALNNNAWNKGLTKETNNSLKKASLTYVNHYQSGYIKHWNKNQTKETNNSTLSQSLHASKTIREKLSNNQWHWDAPYSKTYQYKGYKLRSTFELEFAKWMDKNNINWIQNNEGFNYLFEKQIHKYFPDFYLPDLDLYIEIKGYAKIKDVAKLLQFPYKINIYFFEDLAKLGVYSKGEDFITKTKFLFPLYLLDKTPII